MIYTKVSVNTDKCKKKDNNPQENDNISHN